MENIKERFNILWKIIYVLIFDVIYRKYKDFMELNYIDVRLYLFFIRLIFFYYYLSIRKSENIILALSYW